MNRKSLKLAISVVFVAAITASAQSPVMRTAYHDYRLVTVAEGLADPWAIAFLPDGDILISEKPGRLRIVRGGQLIAEPVSGVPEVFAQRQGGLLDVVPHPDFSSNRLLYLTFSKPLPGGESTTAVARGRFEGNRLTGVEEIFEAQTRGRGHYGSRLAFDGNGYIFVTVGERQARAAGDLERHPAQDLSNHHGVVVRMHEDGRVPPDNPFVDRQDVLPEIWTYGHRNPQGLVIHPDTGEVWITEHGPQGGDELNLLRPGANYGWPVVGYGVNYNTGLAIHEGTLREGMESPVHFWVPSIATSGLMVYTGDHFPEWKGNILAGGLAGQQVVRLVMEGPAVVHEETILRGVGRIRDVRQGLDGYIYVAVDGEDGALTEVFRLEPVSGS